MNTNALKHSLCQTCTENQHCTLSQMSDEPIQYCEEFYAAPAASQEVPHDPSYLKLMPMEEIYQNSYNNEALANLKGLCINCEHVGRCRSVRENLAVWYCEEYE